MAKNKRGRTSSYVEFDLTDHKLTHIGVVLYDKGMFRQEAHGVLSIMGHSEDTEQDIDISLSPKDLRKLFRSFLVMYPRYILTRGIDRIYGR